MEQPAVQLSVCERTKRKVHELMAADSKEIDGKYKLMLLRLAVCEGLRQAWKFAFAFRFLC